MFAGFLSPDIPDARAVHAFRRIFLRPEEENSNARLYWLFTRKKALLAEIGTITVCPLFVVIAVQTVAGKVPDFSKT